jgi:transglutaminase-like putative cysteine protease
VGGTGLMVRRARVLAPLALAALSVVAALSLGRVVASDRYVVPVVAAALVPHALGALVRWRGWSVWIGWVLAALGLVVFVVVALEPSTTTAGLPGADTWHAIQTQLSGGWHLLRTAPAPAPTTDGAILLSVIAVWCMATLADWLAFSRQTALAAVSPALVFFVWSSTLGTTDAQLPLTVGFCVASGAFVLAQNLALLDQRRSWLVSQRGAHPRWLAPAALLGGAAIAVAVVVAPIVPGSGSDPLLDVAGSGRHGSGGHSYKPSLVPFVDIGQKLRAVKNVELFTVKSDVPDYWRIAALDTYSDANGGSWTLSAEGDGSVGVGLPSDPPSGAVEQQFAIGPLGERWLPAAYDPAAITLDNTLVVESSGTLVADADEVSGLRYRVWSKMPPLAGTTFSPEQIAATAATPPSSVRRFLALPQTSDIQQISAIAKQVVDNAGATTPYAQAAALRDWFRDDGRFTYDTSVGDADDGSAILQFLNTRRGFCVQFASAYAVMARSLGIPARVAVGFTPGKRGSDGRYHVTSHDAHAWPEIYLDGMGWTHLFDPTPGNQPGTTSGGSALPHDDASTTPAPATVPPVTAAPAPTPGSASNPSGTGTAPGGSTPVPPKVAPTSSSSSSTDAWVLVLAVLALVVLVVAAYVFAVLALKRRRRGRRRSAATAALAVTGAWEEALDRLHEADVVPDAAQTPLDLAGSVPDGTTPATAQPMRELARVYGAARYGDDAIASDDARGAWDSLDELERALDDGVSWRRRWRRRLDVSTLVRR